MLTPTQPTIRSHLRIRQPFLKPLHHTTILLLFLSYFYHLYCCSFSIARTAYYLICCALLTLPALFFFLFLFLSFFSLLLLFLFVPFLSLPSSSLLFSFSLLFSYISIRYYPSLIPISVCPSPLSLFFYFFTSLLPIIVNFTHCSILSNYLPFPFLLHLFTISSHSSLFRFPTFLFP